MSIAFFNFFSCAPEHPQCTIVTALVTFHPSVAKKMEEFLPQEALEENSEESSLPSTDDQLSVDSSECTLPTSPEGPQTEIYGHSIGQLLYEYEDSLVSSGGQVGDKIGATEEMIL